MKPSDLGLGFGVMVLALWQLTNYLGKVNHPGYDPDLWYLCNNFIQCTEAPVSAHLDQWMNEYSLDSNIAGKPSHDRPNCMRLSVSWVKIIQLRVTTDYVVKTNITNKS